LLYGKGGNWGATDPSIWFCPISEKSEIIATFYLFK